MAEVGPWRGFGTAHASTATLLLTATDGVLGTYSSIATAPPAELTVLCGERDARYHGRDWSLMSRPIEHEGGLSRWAR
jgi:hypothetical protein